MPSAGLRPCSCNRLTSSCAAWLLPLAWMPGAWFPGFRVPGWLSPGCLDTWLPGYLASCSSVAWSPACLVAWLRGILATMVHGPGTTDTAHPPGHTPLIFQNGTFAFSNRVQTGGALCSWSTFHSCLAAVCGAAMFGMYGRLIFPKGFQSSPSTEKRGLEEIAG